ncbi:MAG: hypothetical protein IPK10_15335 [Bacteroidetes bacterium]|nr:hypothetical protein [Bacteroidota bacterium]
MWVEVTNPLAGRCAPPFTNMPAQELTTALIQGSSNSSFVLPNNTEWYADNDIILNKDLFIGTNVKISFGPSVRLFVPNGRKLQIDNGGTLQGCTNEMWGGIYLYPGGEVRMNGTLPNNKVLIKEATIALEAIGNNCIIVLNGSVTFDRNNVGVYLHDGDFSSSIFNGTSFTCSAALLLPFNLNPYSTTHFKAKDAGSITFNYGSTSAYGNIFTDALVCLDFLRTNLTVEGTYFSQLKFVGNNWPTNYHSAILFSNETPKNLISSFKKP